MASVVSTLSLPIDDTGEGKVISRYFDNLEAAVPQEAQAAYEAKNSVHAIVADAAITSGNWTITVTLRSGETFTTANIAAAANAATIEGAIDSAATAASVTGWTNGDISVSGGGVDTANVVLTFDGTSVAGTRQPLTTVADVTLADGTVSDVNETTIGHPDSPVLQILGTQGWITLVTLADPTTWTLNPNVSLPERSVVEYVALKAKEEIQHEAAYTKILELSNQSKPAQPTSPISRAL